MPKKLLKSPILFYRSFIKPWTQPRCRYSPSCSEYALDAIDQHGLIHGYWLILKRLLRCHPFSTQKEHCYDPVPKKNH